MRNIVLVTIALIAGGSTFAQQSGRTHSLQQINALAVLDAHTGTSARTTATGDTVTISNFSSATPKVLYKAGIADSGLAAGTNIWGDQGFAERFDFNGSDSSMHVLGVVADFRGNINPASTKNISLKLWHSGLPTVVTSTLYYSGFPETPIDSVSASLVSIGTGHLTGTLKTFMFDSANRVLSGAFFVGYNIYYNFAALAGDTLGLASTINGTRNTPLYTVKVVVSDFGDTTRDTTITVQNATQWSDGVWHENYTDNDSLFNNLALYPIVVIGGTTGVNSVTKNDLTLFGNYPNPASGSTNIRFTLRQATDVTIRVMDMDGRVLNTITKNNTAAGEHNITVNTADMPSGNYLYLIRTSGGAGMAGKMTVIR